VYNEFKSTLQQRVVVKRLPSAGTPAGEEGPCRSWHYIYERSAEKIFDRLLPIVPGVQIFQALLESAAAEHAARMTAMDAASKNGRPT